MIIFDLQNTNNFDDKLRIRSYKVSNLSPSTGDILSSTTTAVTCMAEICDYVVDVSSFCHQSSHINVTVSALNRLGEGTQSENIIAGKNICCKPVIVVG